MKIIGIIAEFNPFHNGHKRLIDIAKKEHNADYVIVVQSGDFIQRGGVAIFDKWTRAEMSIKNGADLVIELPVIYSTNSSEFFALGGVSILDKLNIVDSIIFGSENTDKELFYKISEETSNSNFIINIKTKLKKGFPYPKAYKESFASLSDKIDINNSPNFMLGLSYLNAIKKLNSNIDIIPISRNDFGYHTTNISNNFSSANAIRENIFNNKNDWTDNVPDNVNNLYKKPLFNDCLDNIIYEKILNRNVSELSKISGINRSLANKIINNLNNYKSYNQYCKLLNSKDLTYSAISRAFTHLLLNIDKEFVNKALRKNITFYNRILAVNKKSVNLIRYINKNSNYPTVGTLSQYSPSNKIVKKMLSLDITAGNLYQGIKATKYQTDIINEYQRKFNII